jgi:hypothetical protein
VSLWLALSFIAGLLVGGLVGIMAAALVQPPRPELEPEPEPTRIRLLPAAYDWQEDESA